jgi:uncharacterized RDD family membrane protein YckC
MSDTTTLTNWRTEGVLFSRFFAYLVDLVIIGFWCVVAGLFVFFLGFITLGLAWGLYTILVPAIGLIYSAITVGGYRQATIGMRLMGLRVVRVSGGPVDGLTAAVHALFFYVAAGTVLLWLLDVIVGFINENRRMLHDILCGLAVVRS